LRAFRQTFTVCPAPKHFAERSIIPVFRKELLSLPVVANKRFLANLLPIGVTLKGCFAGFCGSDPARPTERSDSMVKTALFVRLEAKPGKEEEVANFLKSGLSLVQQEPATISWFGIRLGPSTFAIFDAFPDEAGRQAHLNGRVAAALMAKAGELLSQPPSIEKADVLAALTDRGAEKAA
jgi:quinol monooxygenase YgiN